MAQPHYVVQPRAPTTMASLDELWRTRGLLWIFIWRDIRVRYKHTLLGALWNVIQPLGLMAVYTFVFGVLFTGRIGEVEYPLFLFPAILLWQLFNRAVTSGAVGLSNFQGVISKVYFPRMIAPAAAVLSGLVDLAVSGVALVMLMLFYGAWPSWTLLLAPLFLGLTLMLALGLAVWLAALDAQYRDIRHALNFATLLWMFATPVMYPISLIPERFMPFYVLNPMVGLIQGFRWSLVPGTSAPTFEMLVPSVLMAFIALLGGIRYFTLREGTLVDTV